MSAMLPQEPSGAVTNPRDDLKQFLAALWPEGSLGDRWLLFWSLPDKHSEWVQTITEATLDYLEDWAQRENVYIGCGLHAQNFGPTLRGKAEEVVAIPGLWLDVDYGREHKKKKLPPTEEDA